MRPPNQAPVVSQPIPNITLVGVGAEKTIDLSSHFSDPDGHSLTYSTTQSSGGVNLTINGAILTIEGVAESRVKVTAKATDNPTPPLTSLSVSDIFFVEVRPPNQAPVVSQPIPNITLVGVGAEKTIDLSSHFSDPDGHSLTYSTTQSSGGVNLTINGAILTIEGVAESRVKVTAKATDNPTPPLTSLSVSDIFFVEVRPPNQAPVVSQPIPNITLVGVGAEKTIDLSSHFSDPDGHSLTYSTTQSSGGVNLTINGAILTIEGVAESRVKVTAKATDNPTPPLTSLSVSDIFFVEVRPPNQAPVVSQPIPDITIDVGQERTVTLSSHFSDSDGNGLDYKASGGNGVVSRSLNDASLTITGVAAGVTTVTATATDDPPAPLTSKSVSDSFTVTVRQPKPVIYSISPSLQRPDDPVTISGNRFGTTAESVSFGGYSVISFNSWSNTSISLLIPGSLHAGQVTVTVTTHNGMTSNGYPYTVTGGPVQRGDCDPEEDDCPDEEKEKKEEESEDSGEAEEDSAGG